MAGKEFIEISTSFWLAEKKWNEDDADRADARGSDQRKFASSAFYPIFVLYLA